MVRRIKNSTPWATHTRPASHIGRYAKGRRDHPPRPWAPGVSGLVAEPAKPRDGDKSAKAGDAVDKVRAPPLGTFREPIQGD